MINPYSDINWDTAQKLMSLHHIHERDALHSLYDSGVRHLPYSAYYPSTPRYYPLQVNSGVKNVPIDLLSSPNAEHHGFTNHTPQLHMIGLGSFFESGKPLGENPIGLNDTWQKGFDGIFNNLQYEDGGGIIIPHPHWVRVRDPFTDEMICELLDYDERVLGIEIYSHSPNRYNPPQGLTTYMWDDLLMTGRRVFGYCAVDHAGFNIEGFGLDLGRNILLIPEVNEHECLKAYRNGHCYGALRGNIIKFTDIQSTQTMVSASVDIEAEIKFIANGKVVKSVIGTAASYNVGYNDIYVRVEAHIENDILYSQPIMYKTKEQLERKKRMKKFILMG